MSDNNRKPEESRATGARGGQGARAEPSAKREQGVYGSGGSYGVGGGFDDDQGRNNTSPNGESAPDGLEMQRERAHSDAQQEDTQRMGFRREVDPDATPLDVPDQPRSAREQELADKNRRGSRT